MTRAGTNEWVTGPGPRLFFTVDELTSLRDRGREDTPQRAVLNGMLTDVKLFSHRLHDKEWIAPREDDPVYENLYDRFWALMSDVALLEHLSFTACLSDEPEVRLRATRHLTAVTHRWWQEAGLCPNYGTAYGTTRLVKALAISLDCLAQTLPVEVGEAARQLLAACTTTLARQWFSRPDVRGPVGVAPDLHSPHHSTVEWTGFGIASLRLLGDLPEAAGWVRDAERQFAEHLIPGALSPEGMAPEGHEFWASTVLSTFQFLDALRRVTGHDLLSSYAARLDPSAGLALYLPRRETTAEGNPHYGPSTGLAAVLSMLSRERRDTTFAELAGLENAPGRIEVWPAATPSAGEQMLMSVGVYSALWHPGPEPAAAGTDDAPPTSACFSAALEAYVRSGWGTGSFALAVRRNKVQVWLDGNCVFADLTPETVTDVPASQASGSAVSRTQPAGLELSRLLLDERGTRATILGLGLEGQLSLRVDVDRVARTATIRRHDGHPRRWWWSTDEDCRWTVAQPGYGRVIDCPVERYSPDLRAGYGLLDVVPTDPRSHPSARGVPADELLEVSLDLRPR